jgi:hypothetical protein
MVVAAEIRPAEILVGVVRKLAYHGAQTESEQGEA